MRRVRPCRPDADTCRSYESVTSAVLTLACPPAHLPTCPLAHLPLQGGLVRLQEAGLQQRTPPLEELLKTIAAQARRQTGGAPSAAPAAAASAATTAASTADAAGAAGTAGTAGGAGRGAALKEEGNAMYRKGQYAEALRLYTQAIGAEPHSGAYYGNRAACWLMLRKFERAANGASAAVRSRLSPLGCHPPSHPPTLSPTHLLMRR